jgi:hypothetical protein
MNASHRIIDIQIIKHSKWPYLIPKGVQTNACFQQ